MTTPTLNSRYSDTVAELRLRGYTAIADMSKHFCRVSEMASALGMNHTGSGISKWLTGRSSPNWTNNTKAQEWLDANINKPAFTAPPVVSPPVPKTPQFRMFLASCAPADASRVQKVLTMLNCDFVEV